MVPQGELFPGAFVSTAGAAPVILISRGDMTVSELLREASECHCGVTEATQTLPGQLASRPQRKYLTNS